MWLGPLIYGFHVNAIELLEQSQRRARDLLIGVIRGDLFKVRKFITIAGILIHFTHESQV